MQKSNLIFLIIGGLILLGLGYGYGFLSGQKEIAGIKTDGPLTDLIDSKVITKLNAFALGEVTETSGRSLTLNNQGDTLTILVKEEATINRLLPSEGEIEAPQAAETEEIEFEEIKIGDRVNIVCELKADGSLEGVQVVVLP